MLSFHASRKGVLDNGGKPMSYIRARRRCKVNVMPVDGDAWTAPLKPDEVAGVVGVEKDGDLVAILRAPRAADNLAILKRDKPAAVLAWFPKGYDTKLVSATPDMTRYLGRGESCKDRCRRIEVRWRIFDRRAQRSIVDRFEDEGSPIALAPDGLHYASFENGELSIYALPDGDGLDHK